jgi:7,8-dihydropterin-6-yl-methyl-4-(beta-D-ribofuranosyl)aminobenzene 5'-phosphate synthase
MVVDYCLKSLRLREILTSIHLNIYKELRQIMKLVVLVDNNTFVDQYFLAEPGLSVFIEDEGTRVLFDCGYSDIFFHNARRMGIDLLFLDYLIFSHGHSDHTWGVDALIREYNMAVLQKLLHRKPIVVGHPKVFVSTLQEDVGEIGAIISREKLSHHFEVRLTDSPVRLTERLTYLGEIPRKTDFESLHPIGRKDDENKVDFMPDDTALAYKSGEGLVIITGCSHAGICNIVEHARRVCEEDRVIDIVGGLHLLNPSEKQMAGTLDYLKELGLKQLHASHCTDLASKVALASVAPLKDVGVGLTLEY